MQNQWQPSTTQNKSLKWSDTQAEARGNSRWHCVRNKLRKHCQQSREEHREFFKVFGNAPWSSEKDGRCLDWSNSDKNHLELAQKEEHLVNYFSYTDGPKQKIVWEDRNWQNAPFKCHGACRVSMGIQNCIWYKEDWFGIIWYQLKKCTDLKVKNAYQKLQMNTIFDSLRRSVLPPGVRSQLWVQEDLHWPKTKRATLKSH